MNIDLLLIYYLNIKLMINTKFNIKQEVKLFKKE